MRLNKEEEKRVTTIRFHPSHSVGSKELYDKILSRNGTAFSSDIIEGLRLHFGKGRPKLRALLDQYPNREIIGLGSWIGPGELIIIVCVKKPQDKESTS